MQKIVIYLAGLLGLCAAVGVLGWWLMRPAPDPAIPADAASTPGLEASDAAIKVELLRHHHGTFQVIEAVPLDDDAESFELGGQVYSIQEQWPNTQAQSVVLNDAPSPKHAVELGWGDAERLWIGETNSDDPTAVIDALDLHVRAMPAGERWVSPQEIEADMTLGVRFVHQGDTYPLPSVGEEVFEGWVVRSIAQFEHALLNEQGGITEATDAGFVNRAMQVEIEHDDGTIEQHICFLDHPTLTQGAHPEVTPTQRLAGEGVSQSRMSCTQDNTHLPFHRLIVEARDSGGVDAIVILKDSAPERLEFEEAPPYTFSIDGQEIRILDRRTHARATLEFSQAPPTETPMEDRPAWLVTPGQDSEDTLILPLDVLTPHQDQPDVFLRVKSAEPTP